MVCVRVCIGVSGAVVTLPWWLSTALVRSLVNDLGRAERLLVLVLRQVRVHQPLLSVELCLSESRAATQIHPSIPSPNKSTHLVGVDVLPQHARV